jgi:hypothetical protein
MPDYEIHYVGGDRKGRGHTDMHCVDDEQALGWASGLLRGSLAAEYGATGGWSVG